MKDFETRFFWFNNIFGSFVLAIYFYQSINDGWGNLVLGVYFMAHLLCAYCCIPNDRKLEQLTKEKRDNK